MLIQFSVGNYRSFKDVVTLSMVAANLTAQNKTLNENNLFTLNKRLKLLKSAAIYGANASGKSNLVQAFRFMRTFVLNSARESTSADSIGVEPFRLSTETEGQPSFFEVIFLLDGKQYRYGFETDQQRIHAEWLYHANVRETMLFHRQGDTIEMSKLFKREGRDFAELTRKNALFLSVVDQLNGKIAQSILNWFRQGGLISGIDDTGYREFTVERLLKQDTFSKRIKDFIRQMDLGITDIQAKRVVASEETVPSDIHPSLREFLITQKGVTHVITTSHKKYSDTRITVSQESFDMDNNESAGTQKAFALAGPILHTLAEGRVLIVDELDARLHPLITCQIIELFNSAANTHNAQLIFVTHDTNLLSNKLFRRDQIWFAEKDKYGATDLYSLAEYKVRNDASFEKDYISGKYGAIPYLGNVESLIDMTDG